jgi:putative Ca2+/H+ antiporter (TMEM165/GDT1 family)
LFGFSIGIVAAAVITWSTRLPAMILALNHETSYRFEKSSLADVVVSEISTVAPGALMAMVVKDPWKQINNKVPYIKGMSSLTLKTYGHFTTVTSLVLLHSHHP